MKLVLFLSFFLWSRNNLQFPLTYNHLCHYANGVKEYTQLKNISYQEETHSAIHPIPLDKRNKNRDSRFQTAQSDEDELDSSKLKGNNSLIILALIIAVGYLNYYFKNRTLHFHLYNSILGRQYLLLRVLRI